MDMDTIRLCKAFHSNDPLSENYKLLPLHYSQEGYTAWVTSVKNLDQSCAWIKINCHDLLHVQNISEEDIKSMTNFLDEQLAKIGLTRHDFNVNRIDYDYNTVVSKAEREALIEILDCLPQRIMRMDKAPIVQSVYYMCKSRHIQVYDKPKERINKGKHIKPWEADILRQEVQCFSNHIRHMQRYHGLLPTWDNWVDLGLQEHYLKNAHPIFPKGDFYTLKQAISMVNNSDLSTTKKRKLCADLELVAVRGLDGMKKSYSLNTYKDHLRCFEELGISPLTLSSKYKELGKIKNPFFM